MCSIQKERTQKTGKCPNMSLKYKPLRTVHKYSFINIKTVWICILQPGIGVNANYIGRLLTALKWCGRK